MPLPAASDKHFFSLTKKNTKAMHVDRGLIRYLLLVSRGRLPFDEIYQGSEIRMVGVDAAAMERGKERRGDHDPF